MARKTNKQFMDEVYDLVGEEYEFLDEYISAREKIRVFHRKCNQTYFVTPRKFLDGSRCRCLRRKTHEEFVNEVFSSVGDEYSVLSNYETTHKKVKMKHNICGYEWNIAPASFIYSNKRCPNCAGNARKDTNIFKQEVYDRVEDEYTVLGEYKNSQTPTEMKHNICDTVYNVRPNDFLNGQRCSKCVGGVALTHKEFVGIVEEKFGDEYVVIGEYKNNRTQVEIIHNDCGYHWNAMATNFLRDARCPRCAGNERYGHEGFVDRVVKSVGDEYSVLGVYSNNNTKILMRHNVCDHEWGITPSSFLNNGNRCPNCSSSKGEKFIFDFLSERNLLFVKSKSFKECRNKHALPFDFYINNKILIEYDGHHHFKPVEYWGGIEHLKNTQHRDKIKNQYCIDNNIPLIRIPYWEFDSVGYILDNVLKYFHIIDGQCDDTEIVHKYLVDKNWNHDQYINNI